MANVGLIDRALRAIAGAAVLLALALMPEIFVSLGGWRFVVAGAGVVLILTAVFRFCPAYLLFGVRTCAAPKN